MIHIAVRLTLTLVRLAKVKAALGRIQGPIKKAVDRASQDYVAYLMSEFDKNSKGGKRWRKLKPGTVKKKGSSRILVDTRTMRLALPTHITFRVSVTPRVNLKAVFSGGSRHPTAKIRIADLAAIHHLGLGRVPERRILVSPDARTVGRITNRIVNAAQDMMRGKG